jgi:serine/threonine protein kinase
MGEVYRARDTRLDRIVAIKVLAEASPPIRSSGSASTARRAPSRSSPTRTSARSRRRRRLHRNGVSRGRDLAARLERGPLPLDETLRIAARSAARSDRATAPGIVHRDSEAGQRDAGARRRKGVPAGKAARLRPRQAGGVAVTGPGGTIIPVAASARSRRRALIVGTFQYMAPEQLEGTEADSRADIFAFGAILFEMITGRKAFEGKTQVSLISAILKDEPPPIATLAPVAPKALDRIIRACLAKIPTRGRGTCTTC